MATLDQIQARVENLTRRHQAAASRKAKLEGKLEEKKKELARLRDEIMAAGFDPKNLKEEKARLEAELNKQIEVFETQLSVVETALDEYEK